MSSIRALAAAIFAGLITSLTALADDPSGLWKFKLESPNGRSLESTLTLKGDRRQLSGCIDSRAGKADVSNATFAADQATFTVVREFRRRLRHLTFTTIYPGRLEGGTIKGTIQTTGRDKQPVSLPWEAQRVR